MSKRKPSVSIESVCIVHNYEEVEDEMRDKVTDKDHPTTVGIYVEASVSYLIPGCKESRRTETFKSRGIWGVSVDTKFNDLISEENDQLEDLKTHLQVFGIDVSNFYGVRIQLRQE